MKKIYFLSMTIIMCLATLSCSKDSEEEVSPYTSEQTKVLNSFHGKFETKANISGNISTIVFLERYEKPKEFIGRNMAGEKTTIMIDGIFKTYYTPDTDSKYRYAYCILSNGIDLRSYFLYDDNTISTNSTPDKYKVIINSENEFKMTDINFPYNPEIYYRK